MKQTTPTLPLRLVEAELFRLSQITRGLFEAAQVLEKASEKNLERDLQKALVHCAAGLNPDLTAKERREIAAFPLMTIAMEEAYCKVERIIAVLKLCGPMPKEDAKVNALLQATLDAKAGPGATREEIVKNLPWLLESALQYLMADQALKVPTSGTAVATRMIACLLEVLQRDPDMNKKAPEHVEEKAERARRLN